MASDDFEDESDPDDFDDEESDDDELDSEDEDDELSDELDAVVLRFLLRPSRLSFL
ncbi:MAG: hypothetical protein ABWZ15_09075 [Acidimicrobiia bacterium]